MAGSRPWPLTYWRGSRRRQVARLRAARDEYPARSRDWHRLNGLLVFAERKLAELEDR
ncbi:MAG: hypothetical protein JWN15_2436 [Firmicutes bacterium]|nr:hypothetical protein [Bacillota bacterium]